MHGTDESHEMWRMCPGDDGDVLWLRHCELRPENDHCAADQTRLAVMCVASLVQRIFNSVCLTFCQKWFPLFREPSDEVLSIAAHLFYIRWQILMEDLRWQVCTQPSLAPVWWAQITGNMSTRSIKGTLNMRSRPPAAAYRPGGAEQTDIVLWEKMKLN